MSSVQFMSSAAIGPVISYRAKFLFSHDLVLHSFLWFKLLRVERTCVLDITPSPFVFFFSPPFFAALTFSTLFYFVVSKSSSSFSSMYRTFWLSLSSSGCSHTCSSDAYLLAQRMSCESFCTIFLYAHRQLFCTRRLRGQEDWTPYAA